MKDSKVSNKKQYQLYVPDGKWEKALIHGDIACPVCGNAMYVYQENFYTLLGFCVNCKEYFVK